MLKIPECIYLSIYLLTIKLPRTWIVTGVTSDVGVPSTH